MTADAPTSPPHADAAEHATSETILSVRKLRKAFGGLVAVDDFAVDIPTGQIVSTIGPNGAGKSTIFNLVSGLIPPDTGEILFRGSDLRHRPSHDRARLGIGRTFQNIRLFPEMNVLENALAGRHARTKAGVGALVLGLPWVRQEERESVRKSLEALHFVNPELVERRNEEASSLPYGLQRELEIARALAVEPSLLMLDEPAAGLNDAESENLKELIRRMRDSGVTIWLIEHDMSVVMDVSDTVVVLDHGEVIAAGEPHEVQEDPAVIEAYLGADDDDEFFAGLGAQDTEESAP